MGKNEGGGQEAKRFCNCQQYESFQSVFVLRGNADLVQSREMIAGPGQWSA